MTDQQLHDRVLEILEQHGITTNAQTVAQLIMNEISESQMPECHMPEVDHVFSFNSIVSQVKLGGTPHQMLTVHMLKQVPIDMLYAEGFRNWDGLMLLLPLWALPVMEEGEILECIDGSRVTVGTDPIDDDTRGGCIAYGVPRSDIPRKEYA